MVNHSDKGCQEKKRQGLRLVTHRYDSRPGAKGSALRLPCPGVTPRPFWPYRPKAYRF